MKELYYFKNQGHPQLYIAQVGISKTDWCHVSDGDTPESVAEKMRMNRFDVLPIKSENGHYRNCYKTVLWGQYKIGNIERYEVSKADCIYYLTTIEDAIVHFATSQKKFFFLSNHSEILGLATLNNLNCKHVYLYLYNMVIQLEHALGDYIYRSGVKDSDLVLQFEQRVNSQNAKDVVKRYQEDSVNGLEYDFIEYLYLSDLNYVFRKNGLIKEIGMKGDEFNSIMYKVNDIRSIVAHPNKSLIRDESSIHELDAAIKGIDTLLHKLQ